MTIRERLNEDLKAATRSGDTVRRDTLRLLLAAIRKAEQAAEAAAYERLAAGKTPEEIEAAGIRVEPVHFDDDAVLTVLRREVKQRQDSIVAYQKANRPDLVAREEAELAVLTDYLPAQLDRAAIAEIVQRIIEEVGATGPGDMKRVMPRAMQELRGKADGREVNAVVSELLAQRR
ncbi:MAG: aspartyl-tRNA amidotransferase subunit B [Dehalococcoidia bacterium]|jgi:uncharacterized protein YqeY|nr:MAG: aspartyl-tRNA amidotransferase subunit B [Dehalococcoidia bacterium]